MKRFQLNGLGWTVVWLALVLTSCSENDPQPTNLVQSEKLLERAASELQLFLRTGNFNLDFSELKFDVELYKISYKTTYQGNEITASALVALPKKTTGALPMVSFQHGTIAAHNEAPTALPLNNGQLILYTALSSPGFICVVPDFIGFGDSKSVLHPYYVKDVTATSIIDALKAARQLASDKDIEFNRKLFLAGYSQGGYATMATHRAIETNGLDGFDLVASFPASGGYDVKGMQEYFFSLDTYDQPFFLAYVAMAYRTSYSWSQPLTDFFNEPYASKIPTLFNGGLSGSQINAQLTNDIATLVNPQLLASIDSDTRYQYIREAFNENSLTDWTPRVRMFMYHGDADLTVPYANSVATYDKLRANGAAASVVTFTSLPNKDHGTGVVPYIELFIPSMLELR